MNCLLTAKNAEAAKRKRKGVDSVIYLLLIAKSAEVAKRKGKGVNSPLLFC